MELKNTKDFLKFTQLNQSYFYKIYSFMVILVCQSLDNAKVQKICRRLLESKQNKQTKNSNQTNKKKKKSHFY